MAKSSLRDTFILENDSYQPGGGEHHKEKLCFCGSFVMLESNLFIYIPLGPPNYLSQFLK